MLLVGMIGAKHEMKIKAMQGTYRPVLHVAIEAAFQNRFDGTLPTHVNVRAAIFIDDMINKLLWFPHKCVLHIHRRKNMSMKR